MNTDMPHFEGRISVSQVGGVVGDFAYISFSAIAALPIGILAFKAIHDDATGWGGAGDFLLFMVGFFGAACAGAWLWFTIQKRWRRWRGTELFSECARTTIDAAGFEVEGLGFAEWQDILSLEYIPDSDSVLIVHTRQWQGLILQTQSQLAQRTPVLHFHIARFSQAQLQMALANDAAVFIFRAFVFHWPRFIIRVVAAYLNVLAGATAIAMIGVLSSIEELLWVFGFAMLTVLLAVLVWVLPIYTAAVFQPKRVRAFELDARQGLLRSTDGRWQMDLVTTRWEAQQRSVFRRELNFISLRPRRGRRLDLLMGLPEVAVVKESLKHFCR